MRNLHGHGHVLSSFCSRTRGGTLLSGDTLIGCCHLNLSLGFSTSSGSNKRFGHEKPVRQRLRHSGSLSPTQFAFILTVHLLPGIGRSAQFSFHVEEEQGLGQRTVLAARHADSNSRSAACWLHLGKQLICIKPYFCHL